MKEFALKHPILTFLLADVLICGVFNTVRAFAPRKAAPASKEDEVAVTIEKEEAE